MILKPARSGTSATFAPPTTRWTPSSHGASVPVRAHALTCAEETRSETRKATKLVNTRKAGPAMRLMYGAVVSPAARRLAGEGTTTQAFHEMPLPSWDLNEPTRFLLQDHCGSRCGKGDPNRRTIRNRLKRTYGRQHAPPAIAVVFAWTWFLSLGARKQKQTEERKPESGEHCDEAALKLVPGAFYCPPRAPHGP